jgi:rod shape determining protein RodA
MRRFLSFRDFDWTLLPWCCSCARFRSLKSTRPRSTPSMPATTTSRLLWIAAGLGHVHLRQDRLSLASRLGPGPMASASWPCWRSWRMGHKVLGARRWISIGPMHFQPSEWVKLVLILAVARYFANLGGRSLTWKDIFKSFRPGGPSHALVVIRQPDLGTTLTYTPYPGRRPLSGRHQPSPGIDSHCGLRRG